MVRKHYGNAFTNGVLLRISYLFMRDSSDTSGFVTVRSNYDMGNYPATNTWPNGGQVPYLFCCSKYSKIIKISYNSGYVTDIQMQNT